MLGVIATVAIVTALYFASTIFAPLVCALFIIALVWPMQRTLQAHLPKLVALAIVILVTVIVFIVFASLISWGFGRVGRSLVAEADRFQTIYEQMEAWLEGHGIIVVSLWAEHFDVRWLIRALQGLATHLNTTVTFWLVVLIYLLLGLLEVDETAQKIALRVSLEKCSPSPRSWYCFPFSFGHTCGASSAPLSGFRSRSH